MLYNWTKYSKYNGIKSKKGGTWISCLNNAMVTYILISYFDCKCTVITMWKAANNQNYCNKIKEG